MTMSDGEVAVRQNGQEMAVPASDLDGQIHVCLDHGPHVQVPAGVDVTYRENPDDEDDLETDGGEAIHNYDFEMRGFGLDEEVAFWSLLAAAFLLIASGHSFASGSSLIGIVAMLSGGLLGYIGGASLWSDRS